MKYRPEIDGLRALALIPVILFHAGFKFFSSGFIGVDIFFVISGYLITTIILNDLDKGNFNLLNFYERRARRILPTLFLVLFFCIPFSFFWFFNEQLRTFSTGLISVSLFISNIFFSSKGDYFDITNEENPLIHTWSLAVEEQYYIFFPLFLLFTWRIGKNKIFFIIIFIFILSLILSEYGSIFWPDKNFFFTPARAWEMLSGSLAAFIIAKKGIQKNEFLSLLGLISIFLSIFIYDKSIPFPSLYTLLPVVGVTLIILFSNEDTYVTKLLSNKIFVGIGLISYAAYLWHQPLLIFARLRNFGEELNNTLSFLIIIITFILAFLTYNYIEKPIRRKEYIKTRNKIFLFSCLGTLFFILVGFFSSYYYSNNKKPTPTFITNIVNYDEYEPDNYYLINESWDLQRKITGIDTFQVANVPKDRELLFPLRSNKKNLLVVGNSHSVDFYNVLSYSKKIKQNFNLARFGIQIADIDYEFYNSPNYKSADAIIICSSMRMKDILEIDEIISKMSKENKKIFICQNIFRWMKRDTFTKLDKLIIKGAATKASPEHLSNEINLQYTEDFKNERFVDEKSKLIYNKFSNKLKNIKIKTKFITLDRMQYVCPDGNCKIVSPFLGKYFFDGGHHTMLGAKYYGDIIDRNGFADILINN